MHILHPSLQLQRLSLLPIHQQLLQAAEKVQTRQNQAGKETQMIRQATARGQRSSASSRPQPGQSRHGRLV